MKYKLAFPFLFLFTSIYSYGQAGKGIPGSWEGKLNLGVELRIVFHVHQNEQGGFSSTADSPDQRVFGIKCDSTIVTGDSLKISMTRLSAFFSGKLVNDSTISGIFKQAVSVPLALKRSNNNQVALIRPQTPRPPFPYKSEDVEYDNADHSLHYGATITIPPGSGPFPAAVLITGSGPQDRNETISEHQPFAVIADALTKDGFVVLRVDDRGVDKSSGNFSTATTADFAKDATTSFDYLLSRPEVDKTKAGFIGHSEGGLIAPMVASQRNDVDFIVLLAAPGIKIDQLMTEQNVAIQHSVGISPAAIKAYSSFYRKLANLIVTAPDTATALINAKNLLQQWVAETDANSLKELGFETEEARSETIAGLVQAFSTTWLKYFFTADPQPYLRKLNTKVLALNGNKDIQVIAASNLEGIRASLKKSKSKQYTIKELPGLNHLFQTCKACTLSEYGLLEETISPVALKEIVDWLNKNVK